jgi:ATP-dependent DNA helicase RecG
VVELPVHPELVGLMLGDRGNVEAYEGDQEEESLAELRVLEFVADNPKPKAEIAEELGLSPRGRAIHRILEALVTKSLLEMTIPDKPNSRNQRYKITPLGNSRRTKK